MVINKDFDNKVQAELDVSNLAKNQYILKVETDKGYFSKKIIIGE